MAELLVRPSELAALDRLSAGLREYQRVSGKLSSDILAQKGGQLVFGNKNPKFGPLFSGLVQLFMEETPPAGSIWEAARARGFRVGRRQYGGDLSPRSYQRAREMMGGFRSILATANPVTGKLSFVRRGLRKARVRFRYGRASYPVSGDFVGPLEHGDRRLNLRAVATFFELSKREQGRRFLGASWLFRRWRRTLKAGAVLQNVNPRSQIQPLGLARLRGSEATGNLELWISSNVPGVRAIGSNRGVFLRVINSVRADLDAYIARKHAEAIATAVKTGQVRDLSVILQEAIA